MAEKLVMVVDDDRRIRELVADMLKLLKWEVRIFSNAEEALAAAAKEAFDVVFADYHLGAGMDGIILAHSIAELRKPPPYIVLMSAGNCPGEEIGEVISAFLQKPFGFGEFRKILPR